MKRSFTKILAAFALLVFMMPSLVAWGQTRVEESLVALTFPDGNSSNNGLTQNQYLSTWTAMIDDYSWSISNFNNNNWSGDWTYIKCGRKNSASVANITTSVAYPEAVTKVSITIDAITTSKINSITLFISSDGSSWTSAGNYTKSTGVQTVTLANPTADQFYKIEFDCQSGSSNGLVTVSKVEYFYDNPSGTLTCEAPTFNPAAGTYTQAQNVTISCATEGATIYYTTNGDVPTTSSTVYTAAINVSTNTTIKAMAVAEGYNNSAVATAEYTIEEPSFNQDWEGTMHGWSFVSVTGDQVWSIGTYSNNKYAKMSGYSNGNNANEDWCISPAFNLGDYTNPVLTFTTARSQHNGNELEVYFSNNYNGDPTAATWTQLTCTLPAQPSSGYSEFTSSGNISLSSYSGSNCYIGFKYTSTTSAAATWELDDIVLESQSITPTITLTPSSIDLGNNNATDVQISKTFTVSQSNLTEGIVLNASIGDLTTTTIAQGAEDTEITWTYTPTEAGSISATITATSTGAETQTLTITGAAFVPVIGYSIDFENEASLYKDWIFTNMMSKQTGNSNVVAHGDNYYGTTGGKATASISTTDAVATPYSLTCFVTRQSDNNSSSTWYVQVSANGEDWTDVGSTSATDMEKGVWKEFSVDLSAYTNVYVRVYYSGSTAVRNIDDLTISTEAPAVLAPTFSPVAGTYTEIQNVTITCATEGATIYYTTDGSTPTNESEEYTEVITVSENTTIKAIAYVGTETSAVATAEYVINLPSVAAPTFNPAAGTYTEAQNVTIACETEGASILYKLTENGEWQAYTTVLTISETTTVWAKATKTGFNDSEVATATYTIAEPITSGTGTITFGTPNVKINAASVTGNDNLNNTWTITTEGTTSFTQQPTYSQVGSSSKPATSITFTMTLPKEATILSFEAKFGGFSSTAGMINLFVGENNVGTGALNETEDVVVSSTAAEEGTVLTVTVTGIAKGVKCYYISYTLEETTPAGPTITVNGYGETNGGYVLLAWPESTSPTAINGMISDNLGAQVTPETPGTYDLYSYDESQEMEWRNYRTNSFELVPGKGYLYASKAGVTLTYEGEDNPDFDDVDDLPYTENDLVKSIYLAGNSKTNEQTFYVYNSGLAKQTFNYLTMNEDGNGFISAQATSYTAPAMTGFFVQAPGANMTLSTTDVNAKANVSLLNINVLRNRGSVIDNAIVSFSNGSMMDKFYLMNNTTRVYIPQGNREMAIANSAAQGEMPVSFRASENGTYTIAVEAENVDMNYLHLIDNMTGADVDLLATPNYTFEARTNDYTSRFRLVFSANGIDEQNAETFAFFNGTSWTVSNTGDATLQVVDITGRIISSETINGNATVSLNQPAGIYMLRLVNGNDVKVQKVVVR